MHNLKSPAPIPHKHAATIKAWADGAKIQARNVVYNGFWMDCDIPVWSLSQDYRIKPEPKPDVEHIAYVKLILDGETGKLKEVALIRGHKG